MLFSLQLLDVTAPVRQSPAPPFLRSTLFAALLASMLIGCESGPSKDELEAAKNTIDCMQDSERIIIRFDDGEARLLMADGTRVNLYQVPGGPGVRYLNGSMELRGRALDMRLTRDDRTATLQCKQYEVPPKK